VDESDDLGTLLRRELEEELASIANEVASEGPTDAPPASPSGVEDTHQQHIRPTTQVPERTGKRGKVGQAMLATLLGDQHQDSSGIYPCKLNRSNNLCFFVANPKCLLSLRAAPWYRRMERGFWQCSHVGVGWRVSRLDGGTVWGAQI
jgi:hypothetical protein